MEVLRRIGGAGKVRKDDLERWNCGDERAHCLRVAILEDDRQPAFRAGFPDGQERARRDVGEGIRRLDQQALEVAIADGGGKGSAGILVEVPVEKRQATEALGLLLPHLGQIVVLLAVHKLLQYDGSIYARIVHVGGGSFPGAQTVLEGGRRGIVDAVPLAGPAPGESLAVDAQVIPVQAVPQMDVRVNDHVLLLMAPVCC